MGQLATLGRRSANHWRICGLWFAVLAMFAVLALPVAAAQADATWTGGSTSSGWSVAGNWTGTPPGSDPGAAGTLTFPQLGSCTATCYASRNDLTGVSATGLVFANASNQYSITGSGVTVGSGGIADTGGGGIGDVVHAPIALSAPQPWAVGSAAYGYNSLTLLGGITGPTGAAVTAHMPGGGDLFVDSDMEVGPVTSNGPGGFHIGGAPGSNQPGSVNATDGQSLTINGGTLIANPGSTTGPLTINHGTLLLGTNRQNNGPTTLHVNGAATLASSTTTTTFINDNGSAAGSDFSQLSATGNISLGGQLSLNQGPSNGSCLTLSTGDEATLVTTTGMLQGEFANAPEGVILTLSPCGSITAAQVQINYTGNSVIATIVTGITPTTTTLATPSPSLAVTNQPVTLTATVSTDTGGNAPAGTVAFSANGALIAGCTKQPVTASGSSGTATCTTSFTAASSPESLVAAFTGASGSGQAASSSTPPQSLTVTMGSTTTQLAASNASPALGASVTYAATVTPGLTGTSTPSGAIAFMDDGSPISGCTAQPLTAGSSPVTATCTVSYPSAGSHSITAGYGGDANFASSSSSAISVTVQSSPTTSATSAPATHVGTTQATLNGSVSTGGATVTWKFEYGRSTAYSHATPLQTIAAGQPSTVSISSVVKRLSPNVRYHYRLVVFSPASASAAAQGADLTFTTRATGRLLGPSGRLSVIGRTILVAQKCQSSVLCVGSSLTTTVHVGKKKTLATVECATGSFRIKAHRTATARARLSATCSRLLRAQPHHGLVVTYTAQSRTGQVGLRKRITLVLG